MTLPFSWETFMGGFHGKLLWAAFMGNFLGAAFDMAITLTQVLSAFVIS